jgi:hypothetical protein
MRAVLLSLLMTLLAVEPLCANSASPVHLRLGEHTTFHIGQIAVLQTNPTHEYTIALEGDAVVVLENAPQERNRQFYRAVRAGNATLLITPLSE